MSFRITPEMLEDVDLSQVLYPERCSLNKTSENGKRIFLDLWSKEWLFTDFDIPTGCYSDLLIFRSLVRNDYKSLQDSILSGLDRFSVTVVEDYCTHSGRANAYKLEFLASHRWLLRFIDKHESPTHQAALFYRLLQHVYVAEKVLSNQAKVIGLFADMQSCENLVAQLARLNGIKTFTMQHGLYVDYGSLKTVNVVNYLHHQADVFLAWGKNTKKLIKRYHPDAQVELCGKPYVVDVADEPNSVVTNSPYWFVILDQSIFDTQNFEMLKLVCAEAKKQSVDVFVKFHPINDKKKYYDQFDMIKEGALMADAQWVFGHTSSLLYEAVVSGCKVLRYSSEVPSVDLGEQVTFSEAESLSKALLSHTTDFSSIAKSFIEFTGQESVDAYALSISKLIESSEGN